MVVPLPRQRSDSRVKNGKPQRIFGMEKARPGSWTSVRALRRARRSSCLSGPRWRESRWTTSVRSTREGRRRRRPGRGARERPPRKRLASRSLSLGSRRERADASPAIRHRKLAATTRTQEEGREPTGASRRPARAAPGPDQRKANRETPRQALRFHRPPRGIRAGAVSQPAAAADRSTARRGRGTAGTRSRRRPQQRAVRQILDHPPAGGLRDRR